MKATALIITVRALDDFRIMEMRLEIRNLDGTLLEVIEPFLVIKRSFIL